MMLQVTHRVPFYGLYLESYKDISKKETTKEPMG